MSKKYQNLIISCKIICHLPKETPVSLDNEVMRASPLNGPEPAVPKSNSEVLSMLKNITNVGWMGWNYQKVKLNPSGK